MRQIIEMIEADDFAAAIEAVKSMQSGTDWNYGG